MNFKGHSPCNSCPYRKDTALRIWDRSEFEQLLRTERETIGTVYGCHKADETVCRGWLINQWNRNLPSIALRLSLAKNKVSRYYLDRLKSPAPLFTSVEEMCLTNFPDLKC